MKEGAIVSIINDPKLLNSEDLKVEPMKEPIDEKAVETIVKQRDQFRNKLSEYKEYERHVKRILKMDIPDSEKLARIEQETNG